jgi:isopenicillin N synthase-like dioxygenase
MSCIIHKGAFGKMENIPVIDVSGLRSPDLPDRLHVAKALGQACREVGFFYIVGHGISQATRKNIFDAAEQFFKSSNEIKESVSMKFSPHGRGYVGLGMEQLDTEAVDRKEAFNMGLELPSDDAEVLAGAPFRGPNLWPGIPGWRDTMVDYFNTCHQLEYIIHRGVALDLGLDEEFFTEKLHRPGAFVRLVRYPPVEECDVPGSLGAGEHTDYGMITILATNSVLGLQVRRRDGVWIEAPNIEDAFVCNIGDLMMRWTNDVYVSTPHRVRLPDTERYSVVFFMEPNPSTSVETIPTCIPPGGVAHYEPVNAGDYLRERLNAIFNFDKVN